MAFGTQKYLVTFGLAIETSTDFLVSSVATGLYFGFAVFAFDCHKFGLKSRRAIGLLPIAKLYRFK